MKLLDGEKVISTLQDEELVLTNLRVSQRTANESSIHRKQIFIKHVTDCELIYKRDDKWMIGIISSFTFGGVCLIAQQMEGAMGALICLFVFSFQYFVSKTITLVISSPAIVIEHQSADSSNNVKSFKRHLNKLAAEKHKGLVLHSVYIAIECMSETELLLLGLF